MTITLKEIKRVLTQEERWVRKTSPKVSAAMDKNLIVRRRIAQALAKEVSDGKRLRTRN